MSFRAAKLGVDLTVAVADGRISGKELDNAQNNLYIMEAEYRKVQTRIMDLDKRLAASCGEK